MDCEHRNQCYIRFHSSVQTRVFKAWLTGYDWPAVILPATCIFSPKKVNIEVQFIEGESYLMKSGLQAVVKWAEKGYRNLQAR